ncbi:MAG TPA: ABC transporter permease [Dehalococcoidia bacterium]|nr:ABC transporter permease [Dehalococcoidia bacterium]HIM91674.1 ABC transporter permease [Dehalococcoidia bacterium]
MLNYLLRRALYAVMAIWAVSIISFFIINLPPGDYVTSYIAQLQNTGSIILADEAENLREFYGINRPLYVQYGKWINQIAHGNLGYSFEFGLPVNDVIGERLILTMILALVTVVFIWIVAIPIGIFSAVQQYSIWDHTFTFFGFIGLAVPDFLLALIMMYMSFVLFDFSIGGLFSPDYVAVGWSLGRVWDLMKHMVIPVIILGTSGTATLIRITRANLLDELRKPYVATARAKGLPEWKLVLKYPVRLALNPAVSLTAYILPFLVSGSIVVSVVLGLPTVGPILLKALVAQDMFLAGAIILIIGWMTVVGTFFSDLLLVLIDPRVRFEGR